MPLTPFRAVTALMGLLAGGFHATYAAAATRNPWDIDWAHTQASAVEVPAALRVSFAPLETPVAPLSLDRASDSPSAQAAPPQQETAAARPKAFEYSHGYEVRRKIHVYASVAMLPLFVVQGVLGQKLYDGGFTDAEHTAHQWVAGSILSLFALNTVTGVWNLKEGWGDPSHHKLRVAHGLLMLGADVGFAITTLTAPSPRADVSTHSTHRALAYTSISAATAGYLIMLFGR